MQNTTLQQNVEAIHTSCKDCVFAQYSGITQIGCDANMINKFRSKNMEVIPAYDNDKEFFIINNKQCMFKRPPGWLENIGDRKDWVSKAREEIQIKYQIIIASPFGELSKLQDTIHSAINQTLPPRHITIFKPINDNLNSIELIRFMNTLNIQWRIQDIYDTTVNPFRYINTLLRVASFPFIGIFYAGIQIPQNTFERIDRFINDELNYFSTILPNKDNQGMIIPYFVYKYFELTNYTDTFLEYINKECNTKKIHEVVPNFPE